MDLTLSLLVLIKLKPVDNHKQLMAIVHPENKLQHVFFYKKQILKVGTLETYGGEKQGALHCADRKRFLI